MRILAFDHFFSQDLDALDAVLPPEDSLVRIPYRRWFQLARRSFPVDAFDGLSRAYDDDLKPCWEEYRKAVKSEVEWILRAYSPNLFLVPSDSFFYIRPFIEYFRTLGISTFVMQKETTISPLVMDEHSMQIGHYVPFISDFMTVCSERHKEFWIRSGANPALIEVTGQPRFDVYSSSTPVANNHKKRLLFLSYDDSAYLPTDLGHEFEGTWKELRLDTERSVNTASGSWDVIVKQHPQQSESESILDKHIRIAERSADTRALILGTDLVVGFQTTALYEAVVARKPVIYAAWGSTFDEVRDTLIRFDEFPGLVTWARSAHELDDLLSKNPEDIPLADTDGLVESVTHLGPVDGDAAQRALIRMTQFARTTRRPSISGKTLMMKLPATVYTPILSIATRLTRRTHPRISERLRNVHREKSMVAKEILLQF